jgi:hypothetical protein
MKTLWILAAAATFAACHSRSSDETGAAPDRGDTTMTTIDTTKAPSPSGYDTTAAQPTVPSDTTMAPAPAPSDTTMAPAPAPSADTTAAPSGQPYDTTSTSVPPSSGVDTTVNNPSAPTNPTDTTSQR